MLTSLSNDLDTLNESLGLVSAQVLQNKNFAWEQGQLGFQNGTPVDTDARIRTVSPITQRDAMEVVCGAEYNFFVFAWEDGTYVGCLKADDTFSKGNTNIIAKTSFVFANYPDYDYKFVLKKTSGDNTLPSDGVNCVYHASQIMILQNEVVSTIDERISNIQISKDLTIVNMGDSIFGNFSSPTDISTFLEGITGAKCYNVAFGGTRAVARPTTSPTADRRPFDLTVLAHSICTENFTEQDAVIESIGGIYVEHLDVLKQIDFSTVDILTLSYGTNDYANNQFVGDVSSGINTYAGALNSAANELLQAFPNLRIVFCTPIFRMMESGTDVVPADVYQNNNGNTLIDFVVAAENVAKNIHSFAVNNYYMGVNAENYSQYYTDTTHPNEKMRKLIAANLAYNLFGGHEGVNIDVLKTSINGIQTDVYTFIGNKRIDTWIDGAYIATNTSVVDPTPVSSAVWRYAILDCSAGDIFTLNVRGGTAPLAWAFIDNNNNVLASASGSGTFLDLVITAPLNAVKLVLNDTLRTMSSFYGTILLGRVEKLEESVPVTLLNGNIAPNGTARTATSNGVTYEYDGNGMITANGTATSQSRFLWYNNNSQMPPGFYAGKDYYIDYWSEDVFDTLDIVAYNSEGTSAIIVSANYPQKITIPDYAIGLAFRVTIGTNHSVNNKTIIPKIYACESLEFARLKKAKNPLPMLTIIYDDGLDEFNEYIMPIIQSKNVPIATAVVPESIGVNPALMGWDTIKECYVNGAEVLTHFTAYNEDVWNGFGTQQISTRYYKSINAIRSHGIFTPNALVFSGSSSRYTVTRAAAHRVFAAGFNASNGGINYYGEFDPWFINRYGSDNQTLETIKGWVDDLVSAKTGWMVWTRHNSNATSEDPATAAQILSDAIDYALSKGVPIVTVERGLAEYLDMY